MAKLIKSLEDLEALVQEEHAKFAEFSEFAESYVDEAFKAYKAFRETLRFNKKRNQKKLDRLDRAQSYYEHERPPEPGKLEGHLQESMDRTGFVNARKGSYVRQMQDYLEWVIRLDGTMHAYMHYSEAEDLEPWQIGVNLRSHLKYRISIAEDLKIEEKLIEPLRDLLVQADRFSNYLMLRKHVNDGDYSKAQTLAGELGLRFTKAFYEDKRLL